MQVKAVEAADQRLLVRFDDTEDQLAAADLIKDALGVQYVVALNLAPSTPAWHRCAGSSP